MEKLIQKLKEKKLTIASCESFTAGLFASTMAEVSGASDVLKGGIIAYATPVKVNVIGVDEKIVKRFGVVSKQCAMEMAEKTRVLLDADVCVSFTGNAGPEAMEEKPVGCMYSAISMSRKTIVLEIHLDGKRNELRREAVAYMCEQIFQYINQ